MDFYELDQTYCCVLWRLDNKKTEPEQGAIFGIWGAGGAHSRLIFRIVAKPKRTVQDEFSCLKSETTNQLVHLLMRHEVYIGSTTKAEHDLQQQLECFGEPQWDLYARWKFPGGVESSEDDVDAFCAACYDTSAADRRCKLFRLSKLVLRPSQNREFRVRYLT